MGWFKSRRYGDIVMNMFNEVADIIKAEEGDVLVICEHGRTR